MASHTHMRGITGQGSWVVLGGLNGALCVITQTVIQGYRRSCSLCKLQCEFRRGTNYSSDREVKFFSQTAILLHRKEKSLVCQRLEVQYVHVTVFARAHGSSNSTRRPTSAFLLKTLVFIVSLFHTKHFHSQCHRQFNSWFAVVYKATS